MSALRILTFDSLSSTQDEARRLLESGEKVAGSVVRAAVQTAGRGQRARNWQAGVGGSYQTLVVPEPAAGTRAASSLVIALGLAETLPTYGVHAGLKWPNDLYYRGKKLAGVLVERVAGHLLIGIGLNVNNDVPPGAVGLRGWDLEGAHMVVLEGMQRGLQHLGAPDFDLPAAYRAFDLPEGQEVVVEEAGKALQGCGAGVAADGRLRLEVADGSIKHVSRGHLSTFTLRDVLREPLAP